MPVVVDMLLPSPAADTKRFDPLRPKPWDYDKLAKELNTGLDREPFLRELRAALDGHAPDFDTASRDETPDRFYHLLVTTLRRVGLQFFGRDATGRPPWYEADGSERLHLLQERAALRVSLRHASQSTAAGQSDAAARVEEAGGLIKALDLRLRKFRKNEMREWAEVLDDEIMEAVLRKDAKRLHRLARRRSGSGFGV